MTTIFFIIFVVFLAFVLLLINILLAPHTYSADKSDAFECGFSSFRGQNRSEFNVSFFIFGLIFLLLDLEILLVYPYAVSSYNNSYYGALFVIVFIILLTVGFVFELGKGALKLNSKQTGYLKSSSALYSTEQRSGKGNSLIKNLHNKQGDSLGRWVKRFYEKLVYYAIKIKDLKFKVSYQGRKLWERGSKWLITAPQWVITSLKKLPLLLREKVIWIPRGILISILSALILTGHVLKDFIERRPLIYYFLNTGRESGLKGTIVLIVCGYAVSIPVSAAILALQLGFISVVGLPIVDNIICYSQTDEVIDTLEDLMNDADTTVTEINRLFEQTRGFIRGYDNFISQANVNVVIDADGNLGIDVPGYIDDAIARRHADRLSILDTLIHDRVHEAEGQLESLRQVEVNILARNPNYEPRYDNLNGILEVIRNSYRHFNS